MLRSDPEGLFSTKVSSVRCFNRVRFPNHPSLRRARVPGTCSADMSLLTTDREIKHSGGKCKEFISTLYVLYWLSNQNWDDLFSQCQLKIRCLLCIASKVAGKLRHCQPKVVCSVSCYRTQILDHYWVNLELACSKHDWQLIFNLINNKRFCLQKWF